MDKPKNYEYTNTRTWLIIDPGEKEIEGADKKNVFLDGKFGNDKDIPLQKEVRLGELRTDEHGRLLVLASDGHSFSAVGAKDKDLDSEFDNDGWVDKVCDGTVHVTVKSKSQPDRDIPVKNRATIITGPPRFSSGTHAPTTLYELIEEVYERPRRREAGDAYKVGDVVFYRDIYPMFKRIYLLSWTNNQNSIRNHHGPNKMKYFAGPLFSDPTKDYRKRANLLETRIRAPVIDDDEANEKLRAEQASNEFMPLLGGDDSEPEEGKPNRWASLTQLQYDRLKKWAGPEKNFTIGVEEVPYESFDKIPLDEQPSALTKAGLEWSIGAPMYPGIEVYWVAQRDESYKPGERFRFADTVTPGDLTKGLALPWQSDFSMCNTHWWPSIRPDDVVAETYFDQLKADTKPDQLNQLAGKLKDRVRWARGIEYEDDENKQNSEMVRKWNKLGFVARQDYGGQLEIHIERQRTL
ncbi:unnamed protein product [Rhizoctonia solani]|uniref:Uncharacterized protein n=1 Tax=Rhizoctonia solani TaxID=456999 RepID=A0A8H3HYY0_9AGAM|nr:unnamed protein product [Rhizoctonia solani]